MAAAKADGHVDERERQLTFGTLKAAFYAMLLAAPLAAAAEIYTAYFMAPSLRRKVKPVIELMEARTRTLLTLLNE